LKSALAIASLTLLHALLLVALNEAAAALLGNPHGVQFGATLHYSLLLLSGAGLVGVVLFRAAGPGPGFAAALAAVGVVAVLMHPHIHAARYYALFAGSAGFFAALWLIEARNRARAAAR
jgi:hypothetical protein